MRSAPLNPEIEILRTESSVRILLVVAFAAPLGARLRSSTRFRRNRRVASSLGMIGLGAFVAFGEK
jgi:hypothetical protein